MSVDQQELDRLRVAIKAARRDNDRLLLAEAVTEHRRLSVAVDTARWHGDRPAHVKAAGELAMMKGRAIQLGLRLAQDYRCPDCSRELEGKVSESVWGVGSGKALLCGGCYRGRLDARRKAQRLLAGQQRRPSPAMPASPDIASRTREVGKHYQFSAKSGSLGIDLKVTPTIDRSKVMASCVISTPTVDRVGDLLLPLGCNLENYAKNPVVLWNHGLGELDFPIGTSRDPGGRLAVRVSSQQVDADCYFSQSLPEAQQVFQLIDEGIVKAASVRETPIRFRWVRDPVYGDVLIVEEWELQEWSWVPVGCNPDAVAKILGQSRVADRPLSPAIAKSLMAVASKLRRYGRGFGDGKRHSPAAPEAHGVRCHHCAGVLTNDTVVAEFTGGAGDDGLRLVCVDCFGE